MTLSARVRLIRNPKEASKEIKAIGAGKEGVEIMAPKALHRVVKIENLDVRKANILKQEILSLGGECAVSWDVIGMREKSTNALLMGTLQQYRNLAEKLDKQPFSLSKLGKEILNVLRNFQQTPETMKIASKKFNWKKTYIMGILNLTPDSFSGDGILHDTETAVKKAKEMVREGADIIDLGGESTRPGSESISLEEELKRVMPVLKRLKNIKTPVSIDSYKPEVVEKALKAGASLVNDIYALRSKGMAELIAKHKVPVIIMHMRGTPRNMQKNPHYKDVISEIIEFLRKQAEFAISKGVSPERIIIDPGIGFGKTTENNLEIISRLREFKSLGFPILLGTSRKSFIGNVLQLPVEERLEGTLASITAGVMNGANIVRVHDVREAKRAIRIVDAINLV